MAGITMQGINVLDLLKFISRKSKKFQASFLTELEEILNLEVDEKERFTKIRKLYLDNQNDFARSIVKSIFGEIEHLVN